MQYISTVQAAEKWGISIRRIAIFCKEGRISGAKQVGGRWMIPENAEKPADGRTKAAKARADESEFRYPAFEGRDAASIFPPLCAEELQLKSAMEAFHACRFEEAMRLMGDLPERTQNLYQRINALRLASVCSFLTCDSERFLENYGKLTAEIQQEFPRKIEMRELIHELDALLGDSSYFSGTFRIEPCYAYHESYLPHLAALCTISLFYSCSKDMNHEVLTAYEFICASYDGSEHYLDCQTMHLYLGCTYAVMGMRSEAEGHLRRALALAEQHELYYGIATEYYYMAEGFAPVLAEFSEAFQARLKSCAEDLHTRYVRFSDAMSMNSIFRLLLHEEYIYVLYAAQGYRSKEVAQLLHTSERKVQQKYSEIYDMLNVKNKAELVSFYRRAVSGEFLTTEPAGNHLE